MDPRVAQAAAVGNLLGLLRGDPAFAIANPWADTPTDPMAVFAGCQALFAAAPEQREAFVEAVRALVGLRTRFVRALAGDPERGWMVIYYLIDMLEQPAAFLGLDLAAFAEDVVARLSVHEAGLRRNRGWLGAHDPEGCWGVVARLLPKVAPPPRAALATGSP